MLKRHRTLKRHIISAEPDHFILHVHVTRFSIGWKNLGDFVSSEKNLWRKCSNVTE
jgi:hypothetical protein